MKPLGLGIGINTGYVTVGHIRIGSNRTDYTAIGKNVVVAATLAAASPTTGQILIGQRTFSKVCDSVAAEYALHPRHRHAADEGLQGRATTAVKPDSGALSPPSRPRRRVPSTPGR